MSTGCLINSILYGVATVWPLLIASHTLQVFAVQLLQSYTVHTLASSFSGAMPIPEVGPIDVQYSYVCS